MNVSNCMYSKFYTTDSKGNSTKLRQECKPTNICTDAISRTLSMFCALLIAVGVSLK